MYESVRLSGYFFSIEEAKLHHHPVVSRIDVRHRGGLRFAPL